MKISSKEYSGRLLDAVNRLSDELIRLQALISRLEISLRDDLARHYSDDERS